MIEPILQSTLASQPIQLHCKDGCCA